MPVEDWKPVLADADVFGVANRLRFGWDSQARIPQLGRNQLKDGIGRTIRRN